MKATRSLELAGLVVLASAAGCKPDVGSPPSLVAGPRMLAIRQAPAEVNPGETATFEALVVDTTGANPGAAVAWTLCKTPKPPTESNSVSQECVVQADDVAPVAGPTMVSLPGDSCALFGPDPPPVTPPIQPRAPDTTGGFYVPVRASTLGADGSTLIAFAYERVRCNLANAPSDVARMFNMTYVPNVAPALADVVLDPDGAPVSLVAAATSGGATGPVTAVVPGAKVLLRAVWSPASAETYVRYDPSSRTLVAPREALRVSWFATDGELEHDRTGRTGDEPETFTDDVWTAPASAPAGTVVHFWVVLRDERGGVDFVAFDLAVGS